MKWDLKNLNLKDKNTWLIMGLVGALLLVIALPVAKPEDEQTDQARTDQVQAETEQTVTGTAQEQTADACTELEKRLEDTLSLIDGAGKVRVMITLKDTGEKVVEKDVSRQTDAGVSGGETTNISESSVFEQADGGEMPYVSNELTPQVEGVLVVAEGGGNSLVKQNILQGVMSLFPLEAHKITIVKMSMQEVSEP